LRCPRCTCCRSCATRSGETATDRSQTLFIGQGTDIVFRRLLAAEGPCHLFFAGNPNSQQVYILAQQKMGTAAQHSQLLAEAQKNTRGMLNGMLRSLGFSRWP
jgi:Protein of unknown function (DUF4230)